MKIANSIALIVAVVTECVWGFLVGAVNDDALDPTSLLLLGKLDQILDRLDEPQAAGKQLSLNPSKPSDRLQSRAAGFAVNEAAPLPNEASVAKTHHPSDEDEMNIPGPRMTSDNILQWSIFRQEYPPDYLVQPLFRRAVESPSSTELDDTQDNGSAPWEPGFSVESRAVQLTDVYLVRVHPKNPVLPVNTLRKYAKEVEQRGLRWDGKSCLVVSILLPASESFLPFPRTLSTEYHHSVANASRRLDGSCDSLQEFGRELQLAEHLFTLARQRIGLTGATILGSQCHFLLGVVFQFLLRPLDAWRSFTQAMLSLSLHLQASKLSGNSQVFEDGATEQLAQCVYWSCYRSESDLRVHLPLRPTVIPSLEFLEMFPSPFHDGPFGADDIYEAESPSAGAPRGSLTEMGRQQSWFFYLTEIAMCRTASRILNTLHIGDAYPGAGFSIPELLNIIADFDAQLVEFHARLPPLLRPSYDDPDACPSEELPTMIYTRFCDLRSQLYRPLLYYAIHTPADGVYQETIQPFVRSTLKQCCRIIDVAGRVHRTQGVWNLVRSATGCALMLLAAARCKHIQLLDEWKHAVRTQISVLRYWERESRGVFSRARIILEAEFEQHCS
ncbi:hypothetical protein GQ53DRAFT_836223 [Thozetella sp. PMI_491]|nr:hypothetical protein GQ53DRAFT_836223 [Thozetella sp. PMI_491]